MKTNGRFSLIPVSICVAVTIIAVIPFFYIGEDQQVGCCGGEMPVTHDSAMHHNQMRGFHRGLAAGRIYPRWDDETHQGYGAPTTSFYPPGVYYLTSALYAVLGDWRAVLMGFHLIVMAGSGLAIYVYARETLDRGASLVAMVMYMIAPYHLINQYQRGAIAEQAGFVWAPLVLLFADRLLYRNADRDRMRDFAGLAVVFGAWLWTHPPTAYQMLLVFGLPATVTFLVTCGRQGLQAWARPVTVIGGLLFGSMLAGAYFYPGLFERDLVNSDDVEKTWPYHTSYIYYFAQTVYGHGRGGFFWRLDRIWLLHAAALAFFSILPAVFRKGLGETGRRAAFYWTGAGLLAVFMMTRLSYPIGRFIPSIEIGVFSWRMLTFAGLATALGTGLLWQLAGTFRARRSPWVGWLLTSAAAGLIGLTIWTGYRLAVRPMVRAQAFVPVPEHYNFATLPKGVPRELPRMERVETSTGRGSLRIERWDPEYRVVRVALNQTESVNFRTSYFMGWTAMVNGAESHINKDANSSIRLDLPAGEHLIRLDFRPTPLRRAGNLITAVSFLILISMALWKYASGMTGFRKTREK